MTEWGRAMQDAALGSHRKLGPSSSLDEAGVPWRLYAAMATLLLAYLALLLANASSESVDGWGVSAFELVASGLFVAAGLRGRGTRSVPLVIHPETHIAGELRLLIAERRLGLRCQPAHVLVAVAAIMSLRALVQCVAIRFRIDGHGCDTHFTRRPDDSNRDLAAVRDQNLPEHAVSSSVA